MWPHEGLRGKLYQTGWTEMRLHGPEIWHWMAAEVYVQREGQGREYSPQVAPQTGKGPEEQGKDFQTGIQGLQAPCDLPRPPQPT